MRDATSRGCRTAGSLPTSRTRKPAIEVQKAPEIQVKRTKNISSEATSSTDTPLALRMSSSRKLPTKADAKVQPKNSRRRQKAWRASQGSLYPLKVFALSFRASTD